VVADVLAALDVEESMLDLRNERLEEIGEGDTVRGHVGTIAPCDHLRDAPRDVPSRVDDVCQQCVEDGLTTWVHLRKCLTCGLVLCCDSSPQRHASGHYRASSHPVMRSAEVGEEWRWCFVDDRLG
jgi:CPA1 family monovalent cation:H+ antiporter